MFEELTVEDRISKAIFGLYQKFPMFSYLVAHLKVQKDEKETPTCSVSDMGIMRYNPEFIKILSNAEVMGVLSHEVLHVALQQIMRGRGRVHILWNIAIDIATNYILQVDGLSLPKGALLVNLDSDSIELPMLKSVIQNVSHKSAEEIYDELKSSGGNSSEKEQAGFDKHMDSGSGQVDENKDSNGNGSDGKDQDSTSVPTLPKDWGKIVAEAEAYAKQMGKDSLGMKRELYEIRKSRINWRSIIRKIVAHAIPHDLTFARPHKAYLPFGLYMPSSYGEKVSVLVSIDTSGSISQKELSDFMSEVVAIARSYPTVDFRILTHDVDVHDDYKLANGNMQKLKSLELHGGGGTSHLPLYKYIEKNRCRQHSKLLLSFTDGYSEFPERKPCVNTLFLLAGSHIPKDQMPSWANSITLD